jgi:hypothetical protein
MTRSPTSKSAVLERTLAAVATMLATLVPAGSARAQAAIDGDPVEGIWDFSITRKDCASGAVLGSQKALTQFLRGGALANDNSTPPSTHGAMFGTWKRAGGAASYTVQMVFMRFNPDGTLAGTQRVQREMVLARDHNHLVGSVIAQSIDTAGAVVQRGCATETALRIF